MPLSVRGRGEAVRHRARQIVLGQSDGPQMTAAVRYRARRSVREPADGPQMTAAARRPGRQTGVPRVVENRRCFARFVPAIGPGGRWHSEWAHASAQAQPVRSEAVR
jgi:hypothetical protein